MRRLFLVLSLFFVWATVSAEEIKRPVEPEKPFSVSIGLYNEKISYGAISADDEFSGYALALGQVFLDNFDGRITVYSLDHDDFSSWDSDGYDLVLHWGTGLASQGFKAYIGGGFFKETWEMAGTKQSFSGLQVNGGIGYNWNHIALDFILSFRDPDDYEKFIAKTFLFDTSADAYSGSLLLSFRF